MAVILCPNIDDEHAAFPHRLVITPNTTFVVCANCDHWVNRSAPTCHCVWRCHEQSDTAETVVRIPSTPKKRAQHVVP